MKIEKNIPIPNKYPFAEMQVGDSFKMPETMKRTALMVAAMRYSRKHGAKFITKTMADGSIRCWRVS